MPRAETKRGGKLLNTGTLGHICWRAKRGSAFNPAARRRRKHCKTPKRQANCQTNVARDFANWRNFASHGPAKFLMIIYLASGRQMLITKACTLEGARNAEDPEEDEWGRYFHSQRSNRGGGYSRTAQAPGVGR